MSLLELIEQQQQCAVKNPGIVTATVTQNNDPEGIGRVKVKYGWRYSNEESDWIRIMTPMAGNETGIAFFPDIDDEVVVAFQNGDINSPIVLGMLWSRNIKPPTTNADGENNIRIIKSRSGHKIILDDKNNQEKISIIDKSGNSSLVYDVAQKSITITSEQDLSLVAQNGKIILNARELEVNTSQATTVTSGTDLSISASSGRAAIEASQLDFKGSAGGSIDGGTTMTVKGTQLDLKGSGQGTIEGGGMLTVKSSGIMTIQGSIVNIN